MRTRSIALVFALTAACSGAQRASTTPAFTWRPRSGPAMEQLLNVHRASAPTVSPDGRAVAFLSDPSGLPQPWAITVGADPVAESAWRRLVTDPERVQFVRYAPDGRWLFMGRDHGGDENTQLLRAPASGGAATDLTAAPEVKHLFGALSHDGRWVAYASNARSRGDFDVYVRPAGDEPGAPRRVLEGAGHHEVIDFSLDGRQLAVLHERSNFDQDVLVVDVAAATARNLTPHPTEGDVRYTSPRFTRDGRSLFVVSDRGREHMNLALLDLAAPPPALPRFVLDEAHDLDLLELSPDGATLAAVYNLDGWSQLRLYDVTDPAHPRERARPDVAADRIAVMGGSYGGYMVLAALTLDPELWAAGCDIVGIANFRTFLERTALYRRALREAEYGSLANDGELLDRISPIHRVDRIRAPLFVIHGANDPRVPVTEAEQIVAALRQRNHRVEYLRFENEGHGVSRRENRIRAYGDVVRFFDEVLGGARAQTPPTH